ncbi:glycosyltransferase [Mangrovibacter yixingensis]|uniref:glycosyltransferase n=1 Tax=Mangrovibacter yixingensis TaxID=1529639 RepID=UPI001CFC216F|nr:glycosyltransferase [Mangrovibacter yixingensis]
MKTVGIFRNQLFKGSEVFIQQQAEPIQAYNKCYIGRKIIGSPVNGTPNYVINRNGSVTERISEAYNALTTSAAPYDTPLKNSPALDLIHAHFAIDGVYALALAKRVKVPLITTLHGFDVTVTAKDLLASRSPAWINYLFRQNALKQQGDKFICVSNFIAEQALKNGFPENKLIQHYIGIDTDKYQQRDESEDTGIILHVARLVEKKGTSVLLNALHQIKKSEKDAQLVIVGDGPLLPQLKAQVTALSLEANVRFVGAISHPEVMQWMRKASMLVLPSLTAKTGDAEGLGMVLLEAAVTGVPVIGTNHGGIPEAIIDGKTGFLVHEGNSHQLSERIIYLMNNKKKNLLFGVNAREYISKKFNMKEQTKVLESIYSKLL